MSADTSRHRQSGVSTVCQTLQSIFSQKQNSVHVCFARGENSLTFGFKKFYALATVKYCDF